jgi:hypothetical protein
MKSSFGLQVAVVCLILVIGALCFPMPDGRLLVQTLAGVTAEDKFTPAPRGTVPDKSSPLVAMPAFVAPPPPRPPAPIASKRFRAPLPFVEEATRSTDAWSHGTVEGKNALRDNRSWMIWGPKLALSLPGFTAEDLKKAQEACRAEAPAGAWSLPTAAEFDLAKVNGILNADTDAKHRWIAQMVLPPDLLLPAGRGYAREEDFSVRCIGRSADAPAEGYPEVSNEITLKAMAE